MNKKLMCGLSVALGVGISASAHAQASMNALCSPRTNAIPCARDAGGIGKVVGIPLLWSITRQIGKDWYALTVRDGEIYSIGTFYYSGPNCTGQAYIYDAGYVPPMAQYDGSAIFAAANDGVAGFDWESYSYPAKVNRGGTCVNQGPDCFGQGKPCHSESGGPAIKIETVTFSGELKVR